jgi:hypothetical protein
MDILGSLSLASLFTVIAFLVHKWNAAADPEENELLPFRRWIVWPGSIFFSVAFVLIHYSKSVFAR